MSDTMNKLEKKLQSINRSIGQLERHNTIWNDWHNDEKIRSRKWDRQVVLNQMSILAINQLGSDKETNEHKENEMTNDQIVKLAKSKGFEAKVTIGYGGRSVAVFLKNRKPSRMEVMNALNLSGADYKVKSVRNLVLVQKR